MITSGILPLKISQKCLILLGDFGHKILLQGFFGVFSRPLSESLHFSVYPPSKILNPSADSCGQMDRPYKMYGKHNIDVSYFFNLNDFFY